MLAWHGREYNGMMGFEEGKMNGQGWGVEVAHCGLMRSSSVLFSSPSGYF